jgi:hypothetical protein
MMTDHEIGLWTLGLTAVAGVGTWLALPQIQEWRKRRDEDQPSLSLNLSGALPYKQAMPLGVARAAERTLGEITEALPESSMEWLHTKDFGSSVRWSMVEFVEHYIWMPEVPAREFLDQELEKMRLDLREAAGCFLDLLASYTSARDQTDGFRRIPDQRDEHGNYSDEPFFRKQREINKGADQFFEAYQKLIRRARLKLALSESAKEES